MRPHLDPALFPFGLPETPREADRRAEARVVCHKLVDIFVGAVLNEWTPIRARMVNCTGEGIGIQLGHPMRVGEQFVIRLMLNPGRPTLLIYTVKHVQAEGAQWQIGAMFTGFMAIPSNMSPQEILAALLAAND